ncbi:MAG: 2-succinyl-5-enolpyruvyl-6-hydroxy-3-cyclohexene-1-carboxylic-acid synthase [Salinivirgaceae bacterium]
MQYTGSNKPIVKLLLEQCFIHGIKHVVIAPGSRNAPLIISFANHRGFTCYSIPDERSAGFYAMGMARQLNEPVAVVCTSGTAVLNLAPALTEAYYQEIPVIAITADRPPEWIDQEDGQTIRQEFIFQNHIRSSVSLPSGLQDCDIMNARAMLDQALLKAHGHPKGPVHINVPFHEPLYDTQTLPFDVQLGVFEPQIKSNYAEVKNEVLHQVSLFQKILIIIGVKLPNQEMEQLLNQLADDNNFVVLAPASANIRGTNILNQAEALALSLNSEQNLNFKPDVLISFGGPVVSKAAKQWLRSVKPFIHFDVDENPEQVNTYESLSLKITENPIQVLRDLLATPAKNEDYQQLWQELNHKVIDKQTEFNTTCPWSDYSIYQTFFDWLTFPVDLHLANSTPVRYAELFDKHPMINYFGNRGTSGIDGSTSTAAGAALASGKTTWLLTGDIAFVYDSNAFWNRHLPNNLKVIVINNQGGNIFRLIPGPDSTEQLESFFETRQTTQIEKLCQAFQVNYLSANNNDELIQGLEQLKNNTACTVLEVFTDAATSAEQFRKLYRAYRNL